MMPPPAYYPAAINTLTGLENTYIFRAEPVAKVAEPADALDLGSSPLRGGGSNPPFRTKFRWRIG